MDGWVSIHWGPVWQVELYAGLLDENEIPTFLPDVTTKIIDPFITGGVALDAQLQVRGEDVERARELLARAAEANDAIDEEDLVARALSTPPDASLGITEEQASGPEEVAIGSVRRRGQEAMETLATRVRWAAWLGLPFPLALIYGMRYLGVAKRRGLTSSRHGLTRIAVAWAWVELAIFIAWLFFVPNIDRLRGIFG